MFQVNDVLFLIPNNYLKFKLVKQEVKCSQKGRTEDSW